MSLTFNV